MHPFSLYLVTDPVLGGGREKVPGIVAAAVRGGVTCVQIRDKSGTDAQVAECALATREALREAGFSEVPIFINDRCEVARTHHFHLHVGQTDAPYAQVRRALPGDLMVGLTVGSHAELESSLTRIESAGVPLPAVLGIGPVWLTPTKVEAGSGLGPDEVAAIARRGHERGIDSVAIGGIHPDTVGAVYGVDGICVVSEIMAAPGPAAAARELLSQWRHTTRDNPAAAC